MSSRRTPGSAFSLGELCERHQRAMVDSLRGSQSDDDEHHYAPPAAGRRRSNKSCSSKQKAPAADAGSDDDSDRQTLYVVQSTPEKPGRARQSRSKNKKKQKRRSAATNHTSAAPAMSNRAPPSPVQHVRLARAAHDDEDESSSSSSEEAVYDNVLWIVGTDGRRATSFRERQPRRSRSAKVRKASRASSSSSSSAQPPATLHQYNVSSDSHPTNANGAQRRAPHGPTAGPPTSSVTPEGILPLAGRTPFPDRGAHKSPLLVPAASVTSPSHAPEARRVVEARHNDDPTAAARHAAEIADLYAARFRDLDRTEADRRAGALVEFFSTYPHLRVAQPRAAVPAPAPTAPLATAVAEPETPQDRGEQRDKESSRSRSPIRRSAASSLSAADSFCQGKRGPAPATPRFVAMQERGISSAGSSSRQAAQSVDEEAFSRHSIQFEGALWPYVMRYCSRAVHRAFLIDTCAAVSIAAHNVTDISFAVGGQGMRCAVRNPPGVDGARVAALMDAYSFPKTWRVYHTAGSRAEQRLAAIARDEYGGQIPPKQLPHVLPGVFRSLLLPVPAKTANGTPAPAVAPVTAAAHPRAASPVTMKICPPAPEARATSPPTPEEHSPHKCRLLLNCGSSSAVLALMAPGGARHRLQQALIRDCASAAPFASTVALEALNLTTDGADNVLVVDVALRCLDGTSLETSQLALRASRFPDTWSVFGVGVEALPAAGTAAPLRAVIQVVSPPSPQRSATAVGGPSNNRGARRDTSSDSDGQDSSTSVVSLARSPRKGEHRATSPSLARLDQRETGAQLPANLTRFFPGDRWERVLSLNRAAVHDVFVIETAQLLGLEFPQVTVGGMRAVDSNAGDGAPPGLHLQFRVILREGEPVVQQSALDRIGSAVDLHTYPLLHTLLSSQSQGTAVAKEDAHAAVEAATPRAPAHHAPAPAETQPADDLGAAGSTSTARSIETPHAGPAAALPVPQPGVITHAVYFRGERWRNIVAHRSAELCNAFRLDVAASCVGLRPDSVVFIQSVCVGPATPPTETVSMARPGSGKRPAHKKGPNSSIGGLLVHFALAVTEASAPSSRITKCIDGGDMHLTWSVYDSHVVATQALATPVGINGSKPRDARARETSLKTKMLEQLLALHERATVAPRDDGSFLGSPAVDPTVLVAPDDDIGTKHHDARAAEPGLKSRKREQLPTLQKKNTETALAERSIAVSAVEALESPVVPQTVTSHSLSLGGAAWDRVLAKHSSDGALAAAVAKDISETLERLPDYPCQVVPSSLHLRFKSDQREPPALGVYFTTEHSRLLDPAVIDRAIDSCACTRAWKLYSSAASNGAHAPHGNGQVVTLQKQFHGRSWRALLSADGPTLEAVHGALRAETSAAFGVPLEAVTVSTEMTDDALVATIATNIPDSGAGSSRVKYSPDALAALPFRQVQDVYSRGIAAPSSALASRSSSSTPVVSVLDSISLPLNWPTTVESEPMLQMKPTLQDSATRAGRPAVVAQQTPDREIRYRAPAAAVARGPAARESDSEDSNSLYSVHSFLVEGPHWQAVLNRDSDLFRQAVDADIMEAVSPPQRPRGGPSLSGSDRSASSSSTTALHHERPTLTVAPPVAVPNGVMVSYALQRNLVAGSAARRADVDLQVAESPLRRIWALYDEARNARTVPAPGSAEAKPAPKRHDTPAQPQPILLLGSEWLPLADADPDEFQALFSQDARRALRPLLSPGRKPQAKFTVLSVTPIAEQGLLVLYTLTSPRAALPWSDGTPALLNAAVSTCSFRNLRSLLAASQPTVPPPRHLTTRLPIHSPIEVPMRSAAAPSKANPTRAPPPVKPSQPNSRPTSRLSSDRRERGSASSSAAPSSRRSSASDLDGKPPASTALQGTRNFAASRHDSSGCSPVDVPATSGSRPEIREGCFAVSMHKPVMLPLLPSHSRISADAGSRRREPSSSMNSSASNPSTLPSANSSTNGRPRRIRVAPIAGPPHEPRARSASPSGSDKGMVPQRQSGCGAASQPTPSCASALGTDLLPRNGIHVFSRTSSSGPRPAAPRLSASARRRQVTALALSVPQLSTASQVGRPTSPRSARLPSQPSGRRPRALAASEGNASTDSSAPRMAHAAPSSGGGAGPRRGPSTNALSSRGHGSSSDSDSDWPARATNARDLFERVSVPSECSESGLARVSSLRRPQRPAPDHAPPVRLQGTSRSGILPPGSGGPNRSAPLAAAPRPPVEPTTPPGDQTQRAMRSSSRAGASDDVAIREAAGETHPEDGQDKISVFLGPAQELNTILNSVAAAEELAKKRSIRIRAALPH